MGEQWIQMTGALVVLYLLFTSSVLTTTLAPHCRAFSRALKIEKIKGPLFPGPEGAGNTNGWCINWMSQGHYLNKLGRGPLGDAIDQL